MEIKQLEPATAIVRDECGQWVHPDYLKYIEEHFGDAEFISQEQYDELKRYFNIQTVSLWLSTTVSDDEFEEIMMIDQDLSKWNPQWPDGFFLIDIAYTEEDAQAVFAREIRQECEVA